MNTKISLRKSMMVSLAFAWFLSYADRVNMSVASIAMQGEFGWNETTKGLVMAAVFLGYFFSQMLGGWLTSRVGPSRLLTIAVVSFSTFTLLTPAAARHSLETLIALRFLLGVAEGVAVPATYAFIGRWATNLDRSRLLAIVVCGATIGAPGGLIASGFLVEYLGWESSFYVFGVLGLIWSALWQLKSCDDPVKHPRISAEERALFSQLEVEHSDTSDGAIPVKRILTHPSVWAIAVNNFASSWIVYVFLSWLPSYFNTIQGVSLAGSGLFAALPWIAMSLMLFVTSAWSDGMLARGRDIDFVRKLMQSLGLGGAMVFMLLVPIANSTVMAITVTCIAMGFLAFCYSGASPSVLEVAPRHSGFVTGFVGTIGNMPGFIAVPLIGWLVDATGSYSWGFVTAAGLNVIGIAVWLRYGSGRKVID